jgi:hypothetical protein
VAAGFLYIDVLARRARQHCRRRVPEIRGGDEQGVHLAIVEDSPEILHALGLAWAFGLGDQLQPLGHSGLVHIRDIGDLYLRNFEDCFDQRWTTAQAHDAHDELAGRCRSGSGREGPGRGSGGRDQEAATRNRGRHGKLCSTHSSLRFRRAGGIEQGHPLAHIMAVIVEHPAADKIAVPPRTAR